MAHQDVRDESIRPLLSVPLEFIRLLLLFNFRPSRPGRRWTSVEIEAVPAIVDVLIVLRLFAKRKIAWTLLDTWGVRTT